jgi:hypothetical protein
VSPSGEGQVREVLRFETAFLPQLFALLREIPEAERKHRMKLDGK